jgi:putative ABC transport system permease protein
MDLTDSFFVAFKSLAASKTRAFLTMLGVIIGVFSVVILVALGEGARTYVTDEFAGLGTNILIVTPGKSETTGKMPIMGESVHKLTFEDAETIRRRARGVKYVAPLVFGMGYVKYLNRRRDTNILGVTNSFQHARNLHVAVGEFVSDEDVRAKRRVVVLGTRVKDELFGNTNPLGKFVSVGGTKFRVIGVMEQKGMTLGFDVDDLVFIPVRSAQDLFNTDALIEIIVSIQHADATKAAEKSIEELIAKRHNNQVDFTVTDQAAMLATFTTILDALTYVLGGIAGISLLVGGIGIMNIMLVSVRERVREVGIRKAVGAKRRDILAQFLIESIALSAVGGVIGILIAVLGTTISRKMFPTLPTHASLWSIALAFGFSALVGVFFGVYPARKASLADPVDALRYE